MGNLKAKEIWEAKVPVDYKRPTPNDSQSVVRKWIVAKYEDQEFKGEPPKRQEVSQPPPSIQVENLFHFETPASQPEAPVPKKPSDDLASLFGSEPVPSSPVLLPESKSPTISNKSSPTVQHGTKSPVMGMTSPSQSRNTMQPNYNPPGMGYGQQPMGYGQQQMPQQFQQQYGQQQFPQGQQYFSGYNSPQLRTSQTTLQPSSQPMSPAMSPISSPSIGNKSMGGMGQAKTTQQPAKPADPFADLYQQMK